MFSSRSLGRSQGVQTFCIGSACIYPVEAQDPLDEPGVSDLDGNDEKRVILFAVYTIRSVPLEIAVVPSPGAPLGRASSVEGEVDVSAFLRQARNGRTKDYGVTLALLS